MNTKDDPIVAEMRGIRRELAMRLGDDINAFCDFLVEMEHEHEDRFVNYPPKSPPRHRCGERIRQVIEASSTFQLPVLNVPMVP